MMLGLHSRKGKKIHLLVNLIKIPLMTFNHIHSLAPNPISMLGEAVTVHTQRDGTVVPASPVWRGRERWLRMKKGRDDESCT